MAGRGRNPHQGGLNNNDRNFARNSLQDFIRAADERLENYLQRLDEGDVEEGGTGGGARTKNLAEKVDEDIEACDKAGLTPHETAITR